MLQFLCRRKRLEEQRMICDDNPLHESMMDIVDKEKRSSILELIMNERWHNILEFLSPPSARRQSRRSICAHYDYSRADQENLMNVGNSGNTILHISCMFHPPVHVVEMILIKIPFAVSQANYDGQYPLHISSQYGACPDVIGLLVDHYTPALRRRDNEGKTPLHLSCQSYANNYHVPRDMGLRDPFIPVSVHEDDVQFTIQMITRACPAVVNLEDNQGCNALEYALASDYIHLDTIKCIQRAASRSWRNTLEAAKDKSRKSKSKLLLTGSCRLGDSNRNINLDLNSSIKSLPCVVDLCKETENTQNITASPGAIAYNIAYSTEDTNQESSHSYEYYSSMK